MSIHPASIQPMGLDAAESKVEAGLGTVVCEKCCCLLRC